MNDHAAPPIPMTEEQKLVAGKKIFSGLTRVVWELGGNTEYSLENRAL